MPTISEVRRGAAQQKAQQIDGALIRPVQIVENQDRGPSPQFVEHRDEDVVGLLAVVSSSLWRA